MNKRRGLWLCATSRCGAWANDVCASSEVTVGETLRVVVQFMRRHPQYLHERFTFLVMATMREAWPCQQNNGTVGDQR
jgi:hypothetical protein